MKEYTLRQLLKDLRKLDRRYAMYLMELEKDKEKNKPFDYLSSDEIEAQLVVPVYVLARTWLYMKYFGLPEHFSQGVKIQKREA